MAPYNLLPSILLLSVLSLSTSQQSDSLTSKAGQLFDISILSNGLQSLNPTEILTSPASAGTLTNLINIELASSLVVAVQNLPQPPLAFAQQLVGPWLTTILQSTGLEAPVRGRVKNVKTALGMNPNKWYILSGKSDADNDPGQSSGLLLGPLVEKGLDAMNGWSSEEQQQSAPNAGQQNRESEQDMPAPGGGKPKFEDKPEPKSEQSSGPSDVQTTQPPDGNSWHQYPAMVNPSIKTNPTLGPEFARLNKQPQLGATVS